MSKSRVHILLIGPVTNVKENLIGGATILFGHLVDYMHHSGESYTLINTKKYPRGILRFYNPIHVVFSLIKNIWKADVLFLNSSRGGTKYLAPMLFILAKLFGRKFVFRPFGGNLNEYTAQYNWLQKWVFDNSVLKSDILFLETKALMRFYADSDANIKQLPTSRVDPPPHLIKNGQSYSKRFIYLGFINKEKGIDILLEAARSLNADYAIDMYGPIVDDAYSKDIQQSEHYRRVLGKEEVIETLSDYDVLVLPTYYEGEGYPGVIIEAYSLGIPVITTHWRSIPEIVEDKTTGLLIQPKSADALVQAIQSFNADNYSEYSRNARAYFLKNFHTQSVDKEAILEVKNLVATKK